MFRLVYFARRRDARLLVPGTCGGCRAVAPAKPCTFHRMTCFFVYIEDTSIDALLCRSCAKYYFTSYTVDTMKLGFFGLPFFLSILAILNNTFMILRVLASSETGATERRQPRA